ncbi:sporulation integral membrane protein YtvI [Tumebacillus permanentifrigoris]|uniref:Sporulation integral membrane protein YtvI n=1 Tax=Tumebacillus permanentifrigoris TaxID=378543 RepID=A0A316D6R6_9BACL|nr:sporulation integral membrane protein YtvI [Tumebacillus permanentifrigoris]PWK11302.1 sporulation integral membrane protein YtvI [Tumebacillus permanentifrigoris]
MFPYTRVFWFVVLAVVAYFVLPHSVPILLALVTAIVLEPVVRSLQKALRIRRIWAVTMAFTSFLLIVLSLLYFLTTRMVVEIVELSQSLPGFYNKIAGPLQNWINALQSYYDQLPASTASKLQQAASGGLDNLNGLTTGVLTGLVNLVRSLPNLLIVSTVYVIAMFLFLLDLPGLVRGFLGLFEEKTQVKVRMILHNLNRAIIGFLQAQILISFLTYDLVLVGLWILGVKYALAVSLIIVIVDFLPVLGTGAVIVPWATYAFLSDNRSLGIGLLILYVLIIVFRRIIEPKILGNSLGISALATLISMYLGFMVFGVMGLIVGPALVILFQAFREAGFFQFRIRL